MRKDNKSQEQEHYQIFVGKKQACAIHKCLAQNPKSTQISATHRNSQDSSCRLKTHLCICNKGALKVYCTLWKNSLQKFGGFKSSKRTDTSSADYNTECEEPLTAAQEGHGPCGVAGRLCLHTAALTTAQGQTLLLEYNSCILIKP